MKKKGMVICLTILATLILIISIYMDKQKFYKQLVIHEGIKDKVYYDTNGNRTIGVGFNLERDNADQILRRVGANFQDVINGRYSLSNSQIKLLAEMELETIEEDARNAVDNYDSLKDVRQRVICDMIYNLGLHGFKKFKSTIGYIENKDWDNVADNMLKSKWARQVKGRAKVLASMMRNGVDTYDL